MADPAATCPNLLNHPTVKSVLINRNYAIAMYTVMIWDWLITFPQEYKLIWKQNWNAGKIIFLFQRYWSLIVFAVVIALYSGNWSQEVCNKVYGLDPGFSIPMLVCGNLILILRCYAIWERNIYILGICLICVSGGVATMVVAMTHLVPIPVPEGMEAFACIAAGKPGGGNLAAGFFLAPLVVDLIVTALTAVRVIMYYRRGTQSSILNIFWRDGLFYYVLISGANLLNGIFFLQPKQDIQAINAVFAICLSSILSLRLLLHLRVTTQGDQVLGQVQGSGAGAAAAARYGVAQPGQMSARSTGSRTGGPGGPLASREKPIATYDSEYNLEPQSMPHRGIQVNVSTAQEQDFLDRSVPYKHSSHESWA